MKYLPSNLAAAFSNMEEDGGCLLLSTMGQLGCVPRPTELLVLFESYSTRSSLPY